MLRWLSRLILSFAERVNCAAFAKLYAAPWTDDETVTITITTRRGGAKTVADYGLFGPPEIWALQETIDAVVSRIAWRRQR
jgi:hypothetical protein